MTKVPARWRKASASGTDTNCVEVSNSLAVLRDSKNRAGPVLAFDGQEAFRRLLAAVR